MRENNIKGWMSIPELEFLYETAKGMETIVELGSYLGRSTVALAEGCEGTVWAVDTWEGTHGLIETDGTEFEQFLENIEDFGNVVAVEDSTTDASKNLKGKFDMVFIDADHSYDAVKADIEAWKSKAKKIICGHDYDFEEVKKAVDELIDIDGVIGSIWYKWL